MSYRILEKAKLGNKLSDAEIDVAKDELEALSRQRVLFYARGAAFNISVGSTTFVATSAERAITDAYAAVQALESCDG
jgi:hypothetical protein